MCTLFLPYSQIYFTMIICYTCMAFRVLGGFGRRRTLLIFIAPV
jgi:hypothetical protein